MPLRLDDAASDVLIGAVQKLDIRDGDCLVISTPQHLTAVASERMQEVGRDLLVKLGVSAQVVILEGCTSLAILRKGQH